MRSRLITNEPVNLMIDSRNISRNWDIENFRRLTERGDYMNAKRFYCYTLRRDTWIESTHRHDVTLPPTWDDFIMFPVLLGVIVYFF